MSTKFSGNTIEKSSRSATCLACRLSKLKCKPGEDGNKCMRCNRLGLECQFVASKRGTSNRKRDVARLGPAVRALLSTTPEYVAEPSDAQCMQVAMRNSFAMDRCTIHWHGNECQQRVVQGITTHEGRVALLKHWFSM